jgi:alpha-tubulin suppressor-like RCC1 family protein
VWAWGANDTGQLGDNSVTDSVTPVRVLTGRGSQLTYVVAIAAGDQFSLALRADGTLWAWGSNDRGQLGNPAIINQSSTAVQVLAQRGDLPKVKAIAASAAHGLALMADGKVQAWGWNKFGQVGDGTQTDRPRAVSVRRGLKVLLDDVKAIAAGGTTNWPDAPLGHSLALLAHGRVTGWGHNLEGQTGTVFSQHQYVTMPDSYVQSPVEVPDPSGVGTTFLSLDRVVAIAAGSLHSLAIGSGTLPKPK